LSGGECWLKRIVHFVDPIGTGRGALGDNDETPTGRRQQGFRSHLALAANWGVFPSSALSIIIE